MNFFVLHNMKFCAICIHSLNQKSFGAKDGGGRGSSLLSLDVFGVN